MKAPQVKKDAMQVAKPGNQAPSGTADYVRGTGKDLNWKAPNGGKK